VARNPLKHAPRPTSPAITAADLMTRLYIFADDSMMGRQAGTENNLKGTAYIAGELRRLGLAPAGDSGTYFQNVPLVRRNYASSASLAVAETPLRRDSDYVLVVPRRGTLRPVSGATVVYGGPLVERSTLTSEQVAGKVVVFGPRPAGQSPMPPRAAGALDTRSAAAVVHVLPDAALGTSGPGLGRSTVGMRAGSAAGDSVPVTIYVTRRAAALMLGVSVDSVPEGATGRTVTASLPLDEASAPARNVVAILRGADPKLRNEYVAIGAHNDHIGFNHMPVDHDSLRAYNAAAWTMAGKYAGLPPLTAAQRASIVVPMDSLRRLGPARRDSIDNGADDDGSGTVAVLEIAEALSHAKQKPRRSVLFVWHTGEELGLLGSRWFTDHPTVPRDSIVTQINIDMIGRGGASDTRGGGPDYLGLVGSRRLSSELGDVVEATNRAQKRPLVFDYALDANGNPENIYCRSDHYNYARYGIPIVFFFTGLHGDYHQVTDEPQYIDYPHMERITRFIGDLTARVANLDHRPVVNGEKPDPNGVCRQ
jgi:hypothetical protein